MPVGVSVGRRGSQHRPRLPYLVRVFFERDYLLACGGRMRCCSSCRWMLLLVVDIVMCSGLRERVVAWDAWLNWLNWQS